MNRTLLSPLPVIFATSLLFLSSTLAELEAGFAAVDITPPKWPVTLRGSFNPKPTDAAHDPLHARSFAFRNGEGRAVMTVVDILYISQDKLDAIKAEAAKKSGWKTTEMLVSGTHTHSAPSLDGTSKEPAEVAFRDHAFKGIVESITTAIDRLEPAKMAFGSHEEPSEVYNRRWYLEEGSMPPNPFGKIDKVKMNPPRNLIVKPAGPTDPEVAVIAIRNARNKPMGLFANYALHYVGAVPNRNVSADYFGQFAKLAKYKVGGRNAPDEYVAILSNAASGDINNIDFHGKRPPRAPFEQITQVATKVSDAAWKAVKDADYLSDLPVGIVERRVTLKNRKPDEETIKKSKRILEMTGEELEKEPRLAIHYAMRSLRLNEGPDSTDVAIQAIRIGNQAIVAIPFEVLVEIGLELKEKSPFERTMVVAMANGGFGYLPPPHQHELGGYETWLGTSKMEIQASVILTENLLEMLAELKK
ncbi:MAG: neutral/alkaline non-lysosomal ceramidase N-terminal domain-containing protein [Verrucomicrobiales bacterium]|nr:neutral/alkaline non-lysosomal ceramidase N-terminal domain-containing protein [Verrucomicrobiales bacterium]